MPRVIETKLARIGNSRGIRLPAEWIRRHALESGVVLEERGDELVLRPKKAPAKLSWAETAREIAAADEDWGDWEASMADGLGTVPWTPPAGKRQAAVKGDAKPRRKR